MIIVIVGGNAQSTPHIVAGHRLPAGACLRLVGHTRRTLAAVARATQLLATDVCCELYERAELRRALANANVVLLQIRVGGYRARAWDEVFPHRHGSYGDEGLGAGGLAAAWRSWPELASILAEVQHSAPTASVLMLTSPVGILTRAALTMFPELQVAGICELPWTTLRDWCRLRDADPHAVAFRYFGVNHWGWFTSITSQRRSLIAAPLPLKYVGLLVDPVAGLRQHGAPSPRAERLAEISRRTYATFEHGNVAEILQALAERPAPWYADAIVPWLRGIAGEVEHTPVFLSTWNRTATNLLPSDAVLEQSHRVRGRQWKPYAPRDSGKARSLPPLLPRLVDYESFAARVVAMRERRHISEALRLHPSFATLEVTEALVDDVVAAPYETAG